MNSIPCGDYGKRIHIASPLSLPLPAANAQGNDKCELKLYEDFDCSRKQVHYKTNKIRGKSNHLGSRTMMIMMMMGQHIGEMILAALPRETLPLRYLVCQDPAAYKIYRCANSESVYVSPCPHSQPSLAPFLCSPPQEWMTSLLRQPSRWNWLRAFSFHTSSDRATDVYLNHSLGWNEWQLEGIIYALRISWEDIFGKN